MPARPAIALPLLAAALASAGAAAKPAAITFHKNIAPILLAQCAPCHRPGEAGPFPLLTYDDARKHASQIAEVTRKRYMPPWLPAPGTGNFAVLQLEHDGGGMSSAPGDREFLSAVPESRQQ